MSELSDIEQGERVVFKSDALTSWQRNLSGVVTDVIVNEGHDKGGIPQRWQVFEIWLDIGKTAHAYASEIYRAIPSPAAAKRLQLIERAKELQILEEPDQEAVIALHNEFVHCLGPFDEFWPRWLYFAETHGVEV